MYEAFYGLTDQPFNITPDPKFLYLSESHKEGLAHLLYGIERKRGITVLTGEHGTGKTTLLRCLTQRVEKKTRIAYLVDTKISSNDIYQFLLSKLGSISRWNGKGELIAELENLLLEISRLGEDCIFIVDEAHHLSIDVLDQIRLLSNFETYEEKLIQILLVGQHNLIDKINSQELFSLKQCVGVVYTIRPLSHYETRCYIENRLFLCGCSRSLFTQEAIEEVYKFSNGKPRMINVICDLALLLGFSEEQQEIERPLIIEAVENLNLHDPVEQAGRSQRQERERDRADAIIAKQAWGGYAPPTAESSAHGLKAGGRTRSLGRRRILQVIAVTIVACLFYFLTAGAWVEQNHNRWNVLVSIETVWQSITNWFTEERTATQ